MKSGAEGLLWSSGELSDRDGAVIAEYLRDRLEAYLGHPVQLDDVHVVDRQALTCSIRCVRAIGGPLFVQWRGVLGMDIIEGVTHVGATIFLFSRGRRLQVKGVTGSMIELVFKREENGSGTWEFLGWQEDIYGEWEGIDSLE